MDGIEVTIALEIWLFEIRPFTHSCALDCQRRRFLD